MEIKTLCTISVNANEKFKRVMDVIAKDAVKIDKEE
jgi:hypothetical protein